LGKIADDEIQAKRLCCAINIKKKGFYGGGIKDIKK